jgi:hypothetical protein
MQQQTWQRESHFFDRDCQYYIITSRAGLRRPKSGCGESVASRDRMFLKGDLPPSDGAKGKLGIADLKEGHDAAEEAFG